MRCAKKKIADNRVPAQAAWFDCGVWKLAMWKLSCSCCSTIFLHLIENAPPEPGLKNLFMLFSPPFHHHHHHHQHHHHHHHHITTNSREKRRSQPFGSSLLDPSRTPEYSDPAPSLQKNPQNPHPTVSVFQWLLCFHVPSTDYDVACGSVISTAPGRPTKVCRAAQDKPAADLVQKNWKAVRKM